MQWFARDVYSEQGVDFPGISRLIRHCLGTERNKIREAKVGQVDIFLQLGILTVAQNNSPFRGSKVISTGIF